ncbi:MAG: AAA family ATPase [Chitinophagaceae bacterium]
MELIERAGFLAVLRSKFEDIADGEGHCILLSGESGIGKTSLVRAFCKEKKNDCKIYQGTCDALFTPRPLAPLFDIALQIRSDLWHDSGDITDRTLFFTSFFHELSIQKEPILIVFEDIHWADEATMDFIKFLARRITQLRCFFILTYRDNEIHSGHPLRNVLGQLPPDSFTRLQLAPLSRHAVEMMAEEKGYSGENVYSISGGNPFYVNEILASYSLGVPDNIKDSILSVYNRQERETKHVWQILSVLPTGFEVKYLEMVEPLYATAVERCLESKILILKDGLIFFKHELYRRTIEDSLSPLLRVALNKKILDLFLESFEQNLEAERIIHHAKNANAYDLVVRYAPLAAKQAAAVGAHIEASKLYLSAIEYYQGHDKDTLILFYESYAYECYLTNQIKEAIIYIGKSLNLWKEKNDVEKMGNCMRFLSRLWWFEGNRKQAESFGEKAIEVLDSQPSNKAKAMAYSNMSQLKMLSDDTDECILWGGKAMAIARELDDEETLAHALNSVGSALMTIQSSMLEGIKLLKDSLKIALKNSYHEHVARAYTALGSNSVTMKEYVSAKNTLNEGIHYCEERDLDSLKLYMLSWKARLNLEIGNWDEAYSAADNLLKHENLFAVIKIGALTVVATIKMRRGDADALPLLLEAKTRAFETMELQRIIPALSALLEYEWITGDVCIMEETLDRTIHMIDQLDKISKKNKFYYWMRKARKEYLPLQERYEGYDSTSAAMALEDAALCENLGCSYEQALALFEAEDDDKKKALVIVQGLGANAVYEKLKLEMRASGIKSIPRGIRRTTQSNPALLTDRELDVLKLLHEGMQNKEIATRLFISAKTVDHHISAVLYKLEVNSRTKAVQKAIKLGILK